MIWIILAVIISIIIGIIGFKEEEGTLCSILIVCILALSLAISILCGSILHNVCDTEPIVKSTKEIIALKDNHNETSGQYFLGSGRSNSESYYYYMTKENQGIKINKANSENSFLKFDENPHIETIKYRFKNPFIRLIAYDLTTENIIYCPEGTIDYTYNVDLE